ncbi:MAG: hypothetical protein DRI90_01200 [Deltaproteobacteria bacterium]|nr:MAG: hypothetical protein DRI90_01200 [Deltaproteobacteria bacterium]
MPLSETSPDRSSRGRNDSWFAAEKQRLIALLREYTEQEITAAESSRSEVDLVVYSSTHRFFIEARAAATAGPVTKAARRVRELARDSRATALVVVPYMGKTGRRALRELGVSWLDLSGNARISAPGLHVDVRGRPNRYVKRGRPENLFAPKSSRVVRCLLMEPSSFLSQRTITKTTGLGEGHVSKLVRRLEKESLIERNRRGAVKPKDCQLLINEWRRRSDFSRNHILKGQLPRKTGLARLRELAEFFDQCGLRHSATGLSAAWLLAPHANFRLATLYVAEHPSLDDLEVLGWREKPRAPDTWLVVPRDEGVFHGASVVDGISCVHPVQVYVDLVDQPERAAEAAQELKTKCLPW